MTDSTTKTYLNLAIASDPITEPVTKFGGQPVWIDDPQWPIGATDGKPMTFIAQFLIPDEELRLAYLFMSDDESGVTWEPDGGDNALIVQGPGARIPDYLTIEPSTTGPSIGQDTTAQPTLDGEPNGDIPWMGGSPKWIQGDETPEGDWQFLFQLGDSFPAFTVNFGDVGSGYGFVSADRGEGQFLWQCH